MSLRFYDYMEARLYERLKRNSYTDDVIVAWIYFRLCMKATEIEEQQVMYLLQIFIKTVETRLLINWTNFPLLITDEIFF